MIGGAIMTIQGKEKQEHGAVRMEAARRGLAGVIMLFSGHGKWCCKKYL